MQTDFPFTKFVEIDELPQWSSWPTRLLSLEEWTTRNRTVEEIEREYNKEKYAECMEFIAQNPSASPEDIKKLELGGDTEKEICVSYKDTLGIMTIKQAWKYYTEQCLSLMKQYIQEADIICDFGCGYGYHLWLLSQQYPEKEYYGGEFAQNAVTLADALFANNANITVEQLDLTDPNLSIPYEKKDNILIFSIYAYDNLPVAKASLERLIKIKGTNWRICHLEPVYDWCSSTLLGLLRRAYTNANDYNRDIYSVLSSHPEVHIEQEEREFFGVNPLHPTSFLSWK